MTGSSQFAGAAAFGDWDLRSGHVVWSAPLEIFIGEPVPDAPLPLEWWRERIHQEDRVPAVCEIESAVASGRDRYECAYRLRHADQTYRQIVERGTIIRVDAEPVRVISAVFAADGGPDTDGETDLFTWLEASDEHFRDFVDGLPLLAWSCTPEGWINFYNRRWYEYTGTTLSQMEGWGWASVHDPNDLPRVLKIYRNALASGTLWEDEFRLRRADGEMRWHLSRAMPMRDASGKVTHWFGTNTDIHDQKLALEERSSLLAREQTARRTAEAASRAKDEFIATVSHELRTPLNAIVGWTHVLENESLNEMQQRALAAIDRNVRQQVRLVEDLLDTTRILGGKLKIEYVPVVLSQPVMAAVEALQPVAEERGIRINVFDGSRGATVTGDSGRLQQIAENLVQNAVKFSNDGGRIEVRLSSVSALTFFEVEDRGMGIDAEMIAHVFDRFWQSDSSSTRRYGGLGLGLALVRQLVELHGGSVHAISAGPGKGACFRVELPTAAAKPDDASRPPAEAGEQEPVSLRGIRVLVVDDDPETREVIGELLLRYGASVTVAGTVADALQTLRVDVPEVVLSDIAMPEIDGFGLLERVRSSDRPQVAALPVVALTAYASVADRDEALSSGFDAYLAKPVNPRTLTHTLARLASERLKG